MSNRRMLIIIGSLCFILLVILLLRSINKKPELLPSPSSQLQTQPSPTDQATIEDQNFYSEQYKQEARNLQQQESEFINRDKKVAKFIESLPFKGVNFEAKLNLDTAKIDVIIKRETQE